MKEMLLTLVVDMVAMAKGTTLGFWTKGEGKPETPFW